MELISYAFDESLAEKFFDLCDALYREEWFGLPSSKQSLLDQFSPHHDFYRHPGNAHCHFLALENGNAVGHISAMINADLQSRYGTGLGMIGFFECTEDSALAAALLNAARRWFRNQKDISGIIGPMNFDIWRGYRFMTRGFEKSHFFGEPHNKAYYPHFFEQNSFSVCKRWTTVLIEGKESLQRLMEPWLPCYEQALAEGYRFTPLDTGKNGQIALLKEAIEDSFSRFLYFNTLGLAEFEKLFGAYLTSLDSHFVTLIWNGQDRLAGFAIAFPGDDPEAPAFVFMLGITREESARHKGVGRAALYHCLDNLMAAGWFSVRLVLMAEDSPALKLLGRYADCVEKEYALYKLQ